MTSEKKNEYTLRITQANKARLIVILYEISIDYLNEAIVAAANDDIEAMSTAAYNAYRCVEEMQNNLHYEYELAKVLNRMYVAMKKKLRDAYISKDSTGLVDVLTDGATRHDVVNHFVFVNTLCRNGQHTHHCHEAE